MESIHNEFALYGSKNECPRTDNVFFSISEVCNGTVSLTKLKHHTNFFFVQMINVIFLCCSIFYIIIKPF